MSQQVGATGASTGVDIRTIEAAKENIQPVKTGRKQDALKRALADNGGATVRFNKQIEEKRYEFETLIEKYEGTDPLSTYLSYIRWTQESFVEGSTQSGLLELLNRTVNTFLDDERYKNDSRYLDMWILYCDSIRDPSDAYRVLDSRGIGTSNYLLYKAWGRYLEEMRRFDEAEQIYQLGVDRRAQPVDLMKACQQSFQARMYMRMKKKQEKQALGLDDSDEERPADDPENAGSQRRALGNLRGTGSVRSYASENVGISGLGSKRAAPTQPTNNNAGGLNIFVDDEFASGSSDQKRRRLNSAGASAAVGNKPSFGFVPTESDKYKENQAQATRWTGVQMPQDPLAKAGSNRATASTSNRTTSDFAIFEDDGLPNQPQRPAATAINPSALKLRMVDGSEGGSAASRRIANIQSNPLKPLPYRFKVITEIYEKGANTPRMNSEGQMEISAYDRTAVYPGDGKEYSFEEIRAHRRGHVEPFQEPVVAPVQAVEEFKPIIPEVVPTSYVAANPVPLSPFVAPTSSSSSSSSILLFSPATEIAGHSFSRSAEPVAPVANPAPQEPTLAIFEEPAPAREDFEAPLDKENAPQPKPEGMKKAKAPFRERTVILASSAAAAAPAAVSTPKVQETRHAYIDDEPEPTSTGLMTVHTRAALANFIDMFNAPTDRSLDASNDAEMTTGIVTSLIQVKNTGGGFEIFDDSKGAAPEVPSSSTSVGGFAIFEDNADDAPREEDQENVAPRGSKSDGRAILNRSGIAFAPIEDGSVTVDPAAISGPFYEESNQDENSPSDAVSRPDLLSDSPSPYAAQSSGSSSSSSSSGFTIFEEAPVAINASMSAPFESLIDSPLRTKTPAPVARNNASFAVTPFDNSSSRIALLDVDEEVEPPQRVLDFDNDDLLFSPRTDNNTIANRNIVNSPLSPLSKANHTTNKLFMDNTSQFTITGLEMTGHFDLDTKSILGTQSLTAMLSSSGMQAEEPSEESQSPADYKTVSFKNSMHTVKINAPSKSSSVDPYSAMASQLAPMMKELNLGSSSSFSDLSNQMCPDVQTRPGSAINLGSKSALVLAELPAAGPVGTKLAEVEMNATSHFLRMNPKASAWEFYIARRLNQKLPVEKQRLVVSPSSFFLFRDASIAIYPNQYTSCLQDLIPQAATSIMEEYLAAYCAWHLLDITEALHSQGVIVGNLSARNLFILNGTLQTPSNFKPGGSEWAFRAPAITDLSRAVDTKSFAGSAAFSPSAMTLPPQLQELVASRATCSFEIDALAICDIVHALLFGKPIAVEMDASGRWKVTSTPKSYWKAPWAAFFDNLLNVAAESLANVVQSLLTQLEKYFQANPGKVRSLQSALSNLK